MDRPSGAALDISRAYATVVSLGLCLAVLSPIHPALRNVKSDSYPLSYYPMFAKSRPEVERPTWVVGLTEDEREFKIHIGYWTSGGFNQGRNQLVAAMRKRDTEGQDLCRRIARRVAKDPRLAEVTQLEIRSGSFSRARYFGDGDHAPLTEKVLLSCDVPRGAK